MKLVIAEKPMLARDIARAICGKSVSETAKLPIYGNDWCVVACAGHLLELVQPHELNENYTNWKIDDLPIFVKNWPKRPSKNKAHLVNEIKKLLKQADCVINAGDPDDEGQLIVDEVLEYCNNNKPVKRVFVNDNIEKNIRVAFNNLKDNRECEASGKSAYARQMADMCFGVNETRLATVRLGKLLSVGRVQTPTLGLIVNRDLAIEGHQKQKFYELDFLGTFSDGSGGIYKGIIKFCPSKSILGDEKHVLDNLILENVKNALQGKSLPIDVKTSKKYENPPLPYNLTVLQSDMSKKFKFSAKKTLDITQSLRDKYKAITYNRSDSQYLKNEHYEQASSVLSTALQNLNMNINLDFSLKSSAFNDENVTAHHGIIPQDIKVDVSSMTKDEFYVYHAIVVRYAMQFMKPAEYDVSSGVVDVENGKLKYEAKKLVSAGWKAKNEKTEVEKKENEDVCSLVPAGNYSLYLSDGNVVEKETAPPKRYTEGTLISDMSCIAKYVKDSEIKEILKKKDDGKKGENGGIGTTATRAAIIEKLKLRGYVEESGGKLISTKLGREFFKLLPDDIKSADVTAKWWLMQQDVENGSLDVNVIQESVVSVFNSHKNTAYNDDGVSLLDSNIVGKCPRCGKNVVVKNKQYQCESNKWKKNEDGSWSCENGCQFSLNGYCGKHFSVSQVKSLLEGKQITLKGCVSKKKPGKKFDCKIQLKEDGSLDVCFK